MLPTVPSLLLDRLNAQYGPALAEEIVAGFVRRPVTLRVNTLKSDMAAVCAVLDKAGRIQIPRELLEQLGVKGNKVRVEMDEGKIVISVPKEKTE